MLTLGGARACAGLGGIGGQSEARRHETLLEALLRQPVPVLAAVACLVAISQMSNIERALLARLESLRKGMSPAEVIAVLGEPDDPGPLGMRPRWQVGGNSFNALVVYFWPDGARRVVWLSVGRFHYERNLRPEPSEPLAGKVTVQVRSGRELLEESCRAHTT